MLRAAIVGLGSWGQTLVGSVQGRSDHIRFTHAYTPAVSRAKAFCSKHDIRLSAGYEELLADPGVDAVVLATPNSQHESQAGQAAAARKHVFVEKPFALTSAGARAALAAVEQAGVTLGVGLNRRFHPSMAEMQWRVSSGELGTIGTVLAELTAMTGFHRAAGSWRTRAAEEPAGAMASIGVHLVDAMIWMLGRVREVHCVAERRGGPHGKDTTSLLLRFESGATGHVFCSVVAARNFRIAAYGTKGFAEVLTPAMDTFRFVPAVTARASHLAPAPKAEVIETPGFNYVGEALVQFARSVRRSRPYPVSHDDILHGVEVLEAAVRSADRGEPVILRNASGRKREKG
jgi:predicted dehydrogenase